MTKREELNALAERCRWLAPKTAYAPTDSCKEGHDQ